VTRDELTDRLRRRSVRLIDVRPEIEYRAAHIPGALSIPVITLPEHLNALPKRPEVIAYCRGPYCVMAYKAVEILRPAGYRARAARGRVHGMATRGAATGSRRNSADCAVEIGSSTFQPARLIIPPTGVRPN